MLRRENWLLWWKHSRYAQQINTYHFQFHPFVPFSCLLCSFRITVVQLRLPSCLSGLSTAASCFLVVISLHDQLSLHVFLDGCSLGGSAEQEHRIELFEQPVQEEYQVKSKACDAAAMNSKTQVAAVVKKSALQQLKVSCVATHSVHSCLLQCCRDCFK